MNLLLMLLCLCFGIFYVRLRMDIHNLSAQLAEIHRGSHMELSTNSRQKPLLALCRNLNQVLAARDRAHMRYEKAQKQLNQNITSLAHDIRTPLTGATGYIQLAEECENETKKNHYLAAAQKRLTELKDMLEEMFLYTKLTVEDYSLSIEKLQVLPLLGDCLLSFYTKFEDANLEPKVLFASEDFSVQADEEALRRVFLNLIQNALLHGAGNITILQQGNILIFQNSLAPDSLPDPEQIFDRFYKADPARRKGSSGLGLFIVKELIQKMDGQISAALENDCLKISILLPV